MAFRKHAVHVSSTSIILLLLLLLLPSSPSASCFLIPASPIHLHYHNGPILGNGAPINLHLTFYGEFTATETRIIKSFLQSIRGETASSNIASYAEEPLKPALKLSRKAAMEFSARTSSSGATFGSGRSSVSIASVKTAATAMVMEDGAPSVAKWWSLTSSYTDSRGNRVSRIVEIGHEAFDNYSHGKRLSLLDLECLAKISARKASGAGSHTTNLHLILTAADVGVEGFCMHACGKHGHTVSSDGELGKVAYAWVGNAWQQCPGYCAWPFVRAEYGPDMEPLRAPNGAGVDGMIISLAKVLVGAATNPYGNGYYRGGGGTDAAGVCTGSYGEGAFPGYPGRTLVDPVTGASYNVNGLHNSRFLLPCMWNPLTRSCAVQP